VFLYRAAKLIGLRYKENEDLTEKSFQSSAMNGHFIISTLATTVHAGDTRFNALSSRVSGDSQRQSEIISDDFKRHRCQHGTVPEGVA